MMNEKCAACIHCEVCGFIESEVAKNGSCDFYEDGKRWTSVSERLPEKSEKHNNFLITDSDGNLSISKFYLPLSNSDIDKPYWSEMIDIIAWMPLPEPYKAESEDKE